MGVWGCTVTYVKGKAARECGRGTWILGGGVRRERRLAWYTQGCFYRGGIDYSVAYATVTLSDATRRVTHEYRMMGLAGA